jgi:hypothetical protein
MEAEKISVIYMGLVPVPNKTDNICGKTKVMERCNEVPFAKDKILCWSWYSLSIVARSLNLDTQPHNMVFSFTQIFGACIFDH